MYFLTCSGFAIEKPTGNFINPRLFCPQMKGSKPQLVAFAEFCSFQFFPWFSEVIKKQVFCTKGFFWSGLEAGVPIWNYFSYTSRSVYRVYVARAHGSPHCSSLLCSLQVLGGGGDGYMGYNIICVWKKLFEGKAKPNRQNALDILLSIWWGLQLIPLCRSSAGVWSSSCQSCISCFCFLLC